MPGCVVNVSSLAGVRPVGSSIPHAGSKAALNHTTRLIAATLGPDVRINAVAPGLVDTPWTADVAEVVMGLVRSEDVTGEVVVVDGGLGLRGPGVRLLARGTVCA
ncbi:MAG: short-chain dehydrogenase/reductase [Frankiales bacterium]|nr:short-chain dehydrogenase/reductase [Frankiales bacterium]